MAGDGEIRRPPETRFRGRRGRGEENRQVVEAARAIGNLPDTDNYLPWTTTRTRLATEFEPDDQVFWLCLFQIYFIKKL